MVTHQWIIQTVNTRNAHITVHQHSTQTLKLKLRIWHRHSPENHNRRSSRRLLPPIVAKISISAAGSFISFWDDSRSTAISARLLRLVSDIDARRCDFIRRIRPTGKLRSAVADAIVSVSVSAHCKQTSIVIWERNRKGTEFAVNICCMHITGDQILLLKTYSLLLHTGLAADLYTLLSVHSYLQ